MALLCCGPLASQDGAGDWPRFDRCAGQLGEWAAGGNAMPAADADWLQRAAVYSGSAAYFEQLRPRLEPVLRDLRALAARGAVDRRSCQQREIGLLVGLKSRRALADASALFPFLLEPWRDADADLRADLLREVAEIDRQCYRWQEAASRLDEAEAAASTAPPMQRDRLAVDLAIARTSLELARGRPDLAAPHARAAAECAARRLRADGGVDAVDVSCRVVHVQLQLEFALSRPEQAMATLGTLLAHPLSDDGAAKTRRAWTPRLQNRAALAVLADPRAAGENVDTVVGWLRAVLATTDVGVSERLLAHTTLARHLLDRRDLAGAGTLLAAAAALAGDATGPPTERRVVLATMRLRHALDSHVEPEVAGRRVAELEDCWRGMLAQLQEQPPTAVGLGPLFLEYRRRALVELMRAHAEPTLRRGGAAGAFAELVRVEALGSTARLLHLEAPALADVQAALCDDGTTLLAYVPGHERSLAVVVDAAGVRLHDLALGGFELEQLQGRMLDELQLWRAGAGTRAAFDATATALATRLLPSDLRAATGPQRIAVVGGDTLGYVPFELLPDDDGAPLGATRRISYLPSFPLAVWLAASADRTLLAAPRVVIVACPDTLPGPGLLDDVVPLPFGDDEAHLLGSATGGIESTVLRGSDTTWSRLRTQPPDVAMLQILAHGVRDERRGDPQGLLLGDGTVLWPRDLDGATLPECVLVTACRAGRGRSRRGDDGRHLFAVNAFLAGARTVVLPQLDVDYRGALAFAAALHHEVWQSGVPLDEALRRARAAASASEPSGVDAFLFHLVGLGDRPLVAVHAPAPWLRDHAAAVGIASVLVLAASIGCVLGRRRARAR